MLNLVVRYGSFQQAAVQARVTRSAISQTISHLEQLHGKSLLIRERGDVKPTPYGQKILEQARPVLDSLKDLHHSEVSEGVPQIDRLDIGAFESLAIHIMPKLLERLETKCPGIRITIRVGRSGKLATLVRKGELRIAIVVENDLLRGLNSIPLISDRLGLYVSNKLAAKIQLAKAMERLPVGGMTSGPDGLPSYYSKFLKGTDLSRKVTFLSDSFETVLAATTHGSIIGILPQLVAFRSKEPLVEVTPEPAKSLGRHDICLISQKNCEPRENEFLAKEIRALL